MMNAAFETDLLADLATRRHECLRQLHALSLRQLELIDVEDMSTLLGVLAAKQRLLSSLQELERGMDPFREQDPDQRRWRSPQARQRCAELISQSQSLFAEIIAHEKQGETRMQTHRDQAAARLQGANAGAQARTAYVGDSHDARSLDLSTE